MAVATGKYRNENNVAYGPDGEFICVCMWECDCTNEVYEASGTCRDCLDGYHTDDPEAWEGRDCYA